MSRRMLVSGNWKMHLNHFEAIQLVQKLSYELVDHDFEAVEVSVHPPFTDIRSVQTVIDADRLKFGVGAQNVHFEEKGAFTGEVAPEMLAKLNVGYVIVGHSERRQIFGETDEIVNKKAKAVLKHEMTPIVCCGETIEQRDINEHEAVIEAQLRGSLAGLSAEQLGGLVVAYEPIWAIGTGVTASADDAQEMCAHVRRVVDDMKKGAGDGVRIQYGGSVKPTNANELLSKPDIDGALVGGAALDAVGFGRIVQFDRS
ncbi:MAG: triose-phosphate isomerase [Actinomycetia bacterium]|nr:triose-phosphate isomerase [Actinomycetes bacterium]